MNPDKKRPQLEDAENRAEELNKSDSFLDSIRAMAHRTHTKALVIATLVGLSGAPACDEPMERDKTEQDGNQNEIYQGCEPFSMCMTTGLYDDETQERIGFSFWYKVPEDQEWDDVRFKVLDENGNVIGEENLFLPSGSGEFWVTAPGYNGDIEHDQAPTASGIEVTFPDGEKVTINNGELDHPDDDGPSIGI